jgi:hypothetical protein
MVGSSGSPSVASVSVPAGLEDGGDPMPVSCEILKRRVRRAAEKVEQGHRKRVAEMIWRTFRGRSEWETARLAAPVLGLHPNSVKAILRQQQDAKAVTVARLKAAALALRIIGDTGDV